MLVLKALFIACFLAGWTHAQSITVAAAVSMKEAITAAGTEFTLRSSVPVDFAFGASGQLLAQIRSGAPIDVFISASSQQMNDLEKEKLDLAGSRRDVASNTLVLIASPKSRLDTFSDLKNESIHHIAIGQPQTVPAGAYAQQTLQTLHLYEALQPKIVLGSNVRQVLDYVVSGNAEAGLVYGTDALEAGAAVRVVATADPATHEPIIYPGCVLKRSAHATAAADFLNFLVTPEGQKPLSHHGFGPPTTLPAHP